LSNDFNASGTPVIRQRSEAQDPGEEPVADLSAAHARELRRAQLEQVLSGSVIAVIVHLLGAAVLALVLWPHVSHVQVLAWLALTAAVLSYRVACQILCRARPKTDPRSQRLYLLVACYLSGLIWGSSSMIFLPVLDFPQQAFLGLVVAGVASGAVTTLGADRHAAMAVILACVVPYDIVMLGSQDPMRVALGFMGLIYCATLCVSVNQTSKQLTDNISLRLESDERGRRLLLQATHDALTGLPNRQQAHTRVAAIIADSSMRKPAFPLLLVEVDDIERINVSFGYSVADAVLREIALRLESRVGPGGLLARIANRQFLLALPDHGCERAELLATQLLESIRSGVLCESVPISIGAHIGVAYFPEHGGNATELMRHLDAALFDAKESERALLVYRSGGEAQHRRHLALMSDLQGAIRDNQLSMWYQPKVNLLSHQVEGLEALVRWTHPTHGPISPGEFIPLAEQTGMITLLTRWVAKAVFSQMQDWQNAGFTPDVAINLSTADLRDAGISDLLLRGAQSCGIPPHKMILEITESAVMRETQRVVELMNYLRHFGFRFSIDDFGTGHSSLAQLKNLPVDEMKIDKSFVLDLKPDSDDAIIVRSIISLGHNLGVRVVAEGVETPETWRIIKQMGCHVAQGYLMSKPLPSWHVLERVRALNAAFESDTSVTQQLVALRIA
jgi:diguanylate cyclase (GGDEF)-like protein